ncbi:MAG: hypothetical protein DI629_02655 [Mesorhizobium amorphae]|nr:MAG: hypothetical protein DI629_02655 [Mesorhizobium amorphae]
MYPVASARHLPLPPADIRTRFHVHEPADTRFRACARMLQAVWREKNKLPMGEYVRAGEGAVPLGSRLASQAARAGYNYLSPDIARLVRRELAYRERGALMDEARLWENLLSSSALTFNLLGPLKLDMALAATVLSHLLGIGIRAVDGVYFETSPGRGDPAYIGDGTALDALITYTATDGVSGMIGIEVKYAESPVATANPFTPQTLDIAERSGLFINAKAGLLHLPRMRQFLAEHALCFSTVHDHRHFERGHMIVIAPTQNSEMATTIAEYQSLLTTEQNSILPFIPVSLEAMVAAIHDASATDIGRKLDRRYLDLSPIYELIDEWVPHGATS